MQDIISTMQLLQKANIPFKTVVNQDNSSNIVIEKDYTEIKVIMEFNVNGTLRDVFPKN